MKRRFFLQGIGALTLSQVVAGCKQAVALTVEVLKGSVPAQVANKFRQQFGRGAVNFVPQTQLKDVIEIDTGMNRGGFGDDWGFLVTFGHSTKTDSTP